MCVWSVCFSSIFGLWVFGGLVISLMTTLSREKLIRGSSCGGVWNGNLPSQVSHLQEMRILCYAKFTLCSCLSGTVSHLNSIECMLLSLQGFHRLILLLLMSEMTSAAGVRPVNSLLRCSAFSCLTICFWSTATVLVHSSSTSFSTLYNKMGLNYICVFYVCGFVRVGRCSCFCVVWPSNVSTR